MTAKITAPAPAEVNNIKKRFEILNRDRLGRARSTLRERQRDLFDVLPLLFHTNHPSLPGFVSKNTPVGVSEYRPTDNALEAASRFAKAYSEKRRALFRYEILGLYMMGSAGTVAYSKKSDFDIWICHRQDIDIQGLTELRQKAQLIEQWAAELDLEVHFFLVEPTTFSRGIHEAMSAESSGSAQHHLLMEEFYRTGLLLAGRYPLWWLVPPNQEDNYDAYTELLREKRFVSENEYIDFGPMSGVPAEEFFGAALWQLYKSIDSPYKSVLKLLLMEVYATEFPKIDLLCHRFKQAIYAGETSLDHIDPYVMLYEKIEGYLRGRQEHERLELLRRCFYFKISEPLSIPDKSRGENWRREMLEKITHSWDWSHAYLEMLDARSKWKVDRVVRERSVLVKALNESYRFLSYFAREHAQLQLINQRDLNILGRKLYAAFERKSGKVELINRGISNELWESHLTFCRTLDQDQREAWLVYAAPLNINELRKDRPLRRSHSLIELLAWCHFNNMIDGTTVLAMYSQDTSVTPRELKEMLFSFQRLLPAEKVLVAEMEDFAEQARATDVAVFVNLGVDPLAEYTKQGHYRMSDRNDALSYGGLSENLAVSFDMITVTSWKEVLTSRYIGVEGLMDCLRDYLGWAASGKNRMLPKASAHCFSFGRGVTIRQRIEELFADVVDCFLNADGGRDARYVLAVEQRYFILSLEAGTLVYERANSFTELKRLLGTPQNTFRSITFDRHALPDSVWHLICHANRADVVQVFFQIHGTDADVYVLDERGSLFQQRMSHVDRFAVVNHYGRFFDSVQRRAAVEFVADSPALEQRSLEFHEILQRTQDRSFFLLKREPSDSRSTRGAMDIQVIGNVGGEAQSLTVYCDDQEFAAVEYGEGLFREVARHVLSRRNSGETYPIYITDLDLRGNSIADAPQRKAQTVTLLNFKRLIEHQINAALGLLHAAAQGASGEASAAE
jgi:adenylate cyclase class 1